MDAQTLAQTTGQHLLFLGVDTYNWTIDQFRQAAQFAKAHGVDTLLVKVADGGNIWYGGLVTWRSIREAILNEGVGAIPYIYSYGDKYGALDTEIDILIWCMQDCGIACADMEAEWNGQIVWAQHLTSRIQPVPGLFLVSTWSDPSLQNWLGVIQALAPCVTVWMPQQYNNFLATFWPEFGNNGAVWLQPTLNLTQDFGPNDPVALAKAAHEQGHTALSVWYYDTATNNPGLLDSVLMAFPKSTSTGGNTMPVPQGWTLSPDGKTLTAKNGNIVQMGFCRYILDQPSWDGDNQPTSNEYNRNPVQYHRPDLGAGDLQVFRDNVLWWTSTQGVVNEAFIGMELDAAYKQIDALQAQIATLSQPTQTVTVEKIPDAVIADIRQLYKDAGL